MKRTVIILVAVLLATSSLFAAETAQQMRAENVPSFVGYAPNMIIVQLKDDAVLELNPSDFHSGNAFRGIAELDAVGQRHGVERVEKRFAGISLDRANTPQERALTRFFGVFAEYGDLDAMVRDYESLPQVVEAHKVPLHQMDATPNDPLYSSQWHYYNTYSVNADQAWDMEPGDATVVVGILDSGVKYDHGDLGGSNPPGPADNSTNGNIWVNSLEVPGNGIDDDNNGYVDDVVGWDFLATSSRCKDADCYTPDNDPMDGLGHGTHCAGTVAAINNNAYRVAGVAGGFSNGTFESTANGAKILCCRIGYKTSNSGVVDMAAAAEAMVYTGQLKARGVNVAAINCSWGSSLTTDLAAAVDYLVSQDVLVVVAAGNDGQDIVRYLNSRSDCMSVGATDVNGNPASFSNYGTWVEVAAPGVGIISTVTGTGDLTATYSGTSMAAPHVCGVAAVIESYDASLSRQDKWNLICDPANVNAYNVTKYVGVGIASAKKCLDAIAEPVTDPPVANFSGSPTSGNYPLTVNFTDLSTNSPTSWDWNFGDGSAHVYTQNPSHVYSTAGTYTVTLVAANAYGSDAEVKTGYITVTAPTNPPVAAFTASPTSGTAPLEVAFTDQSTGGATSWTWNFGDGSALSYVQNPTHTYASAGSYDVTLTVSNAYGSDSETKYDYIVVSTAGEQTMHVHDINVWRVLIGWKCDSYVQVWIYDQNNQPVEGAAVTVAVSGPVTGSGTFTTLADGSITVHTGTVTSCSGDFCWEVTNVVKTGYTYNSAANNETKVCESGVVYKGDPTNAQQLTLPNEYGLGQNYPNPFNPTTEIFFSLPENSRVKLEVFNIRGQRVTTLADGMYTAGQHSVTWDASSVASGVYFYRLETDNFVDQKKMLLLK
ncbi:MAG: S8 family serine peptidase [Candidatus Zixiibacteriota bacterium]